ncbi:MAG: phosphatase [Bacteroidota bacterium]
MKKYRNSDLINLAENGYFDVIIHGCNCFHTMGAGIALALSKKYPEIRTADKTTTYGDKSKLGNFTSYDNGKFIIINGYTQYGFGENKSQVNYDAIKKLFQKIKLIFHGKKIGYPKIGAGLAGGDWNIISSIIDKELEGEDHALVLLD